MDEFEKFTPPKVDFTKPYSDFGALVAQRQRLAASMRDIEMTIREVTKYGADAAAYANVAATWAITLFFCDLLRNSLSAVDRRAPLLFQRFDQLLAKGNKVLKLFGQPTIVDKQTVLKSIDPNLQGSANFSASIRTIRDELAKEKIRLPMPYQVLSEFALDMADDSLLIIQASQTSQQVQASVANAQANMRVTLQRIRERLMRMDAEISRLLENGQRRSNTA